MTENQIPQQEETPKEGWAALKEELLSSLPLWAREFLEKHAREIISAMLVIILGIALWSGYSSYSHKQQSLAAAALGNALRIEESQKKIAALEEVIKEHSHTQAAKQAQLILAAELKKIGKVEKAKAAFKIAASKLDGPLSTSATMGFGYASEDLGDLDSAATAYKKAAEREDGFEAVAYLDLGRVESAKKNNQAAIDAYNQYITLKSNSKLLDYVRYKIENLSSALTGGK